MLGQVDITRRYASVDRRRSPAIFGDWPNVRRLTDYNHRRLYPLIPFGFSSRLLLNPNQIVNSKLPLVLINTIKFEHENFMIYKKITNSSPNFNLKIRKFVRNKRSSNIKHTASFFFKKALNGSTHGLSGSWRVVSWHHTNVEFHVSVLVWDVSFSASEHLVALALLWPVLALELVAALFRGGFLEKMIGLQRV